MKPSDLTVTDQFCGAGGSSVGAEAAGLRLHLAMNHWGRAIETHNANFPHAHHACCDISSTDPRRFPSTNVLITSPECTNHSQAKTKKDRATLFDPHGADSAERSRATMMDVPRFTEYHDYDLIVVENVVEVTGWAGFVPWLQFMTNLGYEHRILSINSLIAHPTPQSRDRLYVVFWKKGNRAPDLDFRPQCWCQRCERDVEGVQTFRRAGRSIGKFRQQYDYRCAVCHEVAFPYAWPAAAAIDWSLPTQRIGDRGKPLADATRKRVQIGLERFGRPTIVQASGHTWIRPGSDYIRAWPVDDPLPTQTTTRSHAVVVPPFVAELRGGRSDVRPAWEPLATVCAAGNHHALVEPAFYLKNYGAIGEGRYRAKPIHEPLGAVTARDSHSLVTMPFLTQYNGQSTASAVLEPVPTVMTRDRHALVQPAPSVDDCGFRMLQPHEIKAAMAFDHEYVITGNKVEQVRQCGNAVTPPVMKMILERCVESLS